MVIAIKTFFDFPPHPLTNIEIRKYHQSESRFNGVYSRNNLSKRIKDGSYVINLINMQMLVFVGLPCMY